MYNNLIPAAPLHAAIMDVLADALRDTPQLREMLRQHVIEQRQQAQQDQPDIANLEAEREELQKRITTIVTSLNGAALAAVQPELQRLGERRNALEVRLTAARAEHQADERPVEELVEEAVRIIESDRRKLLKIPAESVRDLLNMLIVEPKVDMATKEVHLRVALPTWALEGKNATSALCPADRSLSPTGSWTQTTLVSVNCQYWRICGLQTTPPCYRCRRNAA